MFLKHPPQLTVVLDVGMLELVRVLALGGVSLFAMAPHLVQLAVRVECLVVVGADLAAWVGLKAALPHAPAAPHAALRIHVALATGAAVELQ